MPEETKINPNILEDMPQIPLYSPEANKNRGISVPISQLIPFENHPFIVPEKDNPEMKQLMQSIENNGLIELPIVRKLNDNQYQIISGHRRIKACEYLGCQEVPVKIIHCKNNNEATLLMLNSNIHRERILLSEKIKSCCLLYRARQHQGKSQGEEESSTRKEIANIFNVSEGTVQRFLELSRLYDPLLLMLDEKRLPIGAAKIISKLKEDNQKAIAEILTANHDIKIKISQANEILQAENSTQTLTQEEINAILAVNDTNRPQDNNRTVSLSSEQIRTYFSDDMSTDDIKAKIFELLSAWKEQQGN